MNLKEYLRQAKDRAGLEAEAHVVKGLGGKVVRGSGSQKHAKGDGTVGVTHLVEVKSTAKKSFSVKKEHLEKIKHEALMEGREPMFAFCFTDETGRVLEEWAAVPTQAMHAFLEGNE